MNAKKDRNCGCNSNTPYPIYQMPMMPMQNQMFPNMQMPMMQNNIPLTGQNMQSSPIEQQINNLSNQINNLEKSIKVRYENLCGMDSVLPENGYHGNDIIEVAKSIYEEYSEKAPNDIFRKKGVDFLLRQIKKDLSDFGGTKWKRKCYLQNFRTQDLWLLLELKIQRKQLEFPMLV